MVTRFGSDKAKRRSELLCKFLRLFSFDFSLVCESGRLVVIFSCFTFFGSFSTISLAVNYRFLFVPCLRLLFFYYLRTVIRFSWLDPGYFFVGLHVSVGFHFPIADLLVRLVVFDFLTRRLGGIVIGEFRDVRHFWKFVFYLKNFNYKIDFYVRRQCRICDILVITTVLQGDRKLFLDTATNRTEHVCFYVSLMENQPF